MTATPTKSSSLPDIDFTVNFGFDRWAFEGGHVEHPYMVQRTTNKIVTRMDLNGALRLRDHIDRSIKRAVETMAALQAKYEFDYTKLYKAICDKANDHLLDRPADRPLNWMSIQLHLRGPFREMGLMDDKGVIFNWQSIMLGDAPDPEAMLRMMAWLDNASWTLFLSDAQIERMTGGGSLDRYWA
jgi:predicted metal-dependent phosphoesterase TrpH